MPTSPDRNRIARAFRGSLTTYDQHAVVQLAMARDLVAELRRHHTGHWPRALELGAGTGLLTRELVSAFTFGRYVVNDLVPEFAARAYALLKHRHVARRDCLPGDVEALTGYPRDLSLVVSGATFQWLRDLRTFLHRMLARLAPGGLMAFTTFGPENCSEVGTLTDVRLAYPALDEIRAHLEGRAEVLDAREWREPLCFGDARAVLRHLKQTGVNGAGVYRWTPRALRAFCREYQARFPWQDGVRLTYHPMLVVARRI